MPLDTSRASWGNSRGNSLNEEEQRLEDAMVDARLEGKTTLADALARRVERLRAQKVAGNVIPFKKSI